MSRGLSVLFLDSLIISGDISLILDLDVFFILRNTLVTTSWILATGSSWSRIVSWEQNEKNR